LPSLHWATERLAPYIYFHLLFFLALASFPFVSFLENSPSLGYNARRWFVRMAEEKITCTTSSSTTSLYKRKTTTTGNGYERNVSVFSFLAKLPKELLHPRFSQPFLYASCSCPCDLCVWHHQVVQVTIRLDSTWETCNKLTISGILPSLGGNDLSKCKFLCRSLEMRFLHSNKIVDSRKRRWTKKQTSVDYSVVVSCRTLTRVLLIMQLRRTLIGPLVTSSMRVSRLRCGRLRPRPITGSENDIQQWPPISIRQFPFKKKKHNVND
jgi:hypothetical protein